MAGLDPIAIYAAVVATVVAVWNVYSEWSARRPRIRVSAYVGTWVVNVAEDAVPNYQPAGRTVIFNARNMGLVDVRLTSCGLARTRRDWKRAGRRVVTRRRQLPIPMTARFPCDLSPGHSFDADAELYTFCGASKPGEWFGFDRAYFNDAVGRRYLGKVDRDLLSVLEEVAAEREQAVGA